jgi:hypothetical protein
VAVAQGAFVVTATKRSDRHSFFCSPLNAICAVNAITRRLWGRAVPAGPMFKGLDLAFTYQR